MLLSKCVICDSKKTEIYQNIRTRRIVKYDWQNSNTWSIINIIIYKNCCNPNVFIWVFTMIMETLKKAKKNQL